VFNNPLKYTDPTGHCPFLSPGCREYFLRSQFPFVKGGGGNGNSTAIGVTGALVLTTLTVQAVDQARGKTRDPNEMTKGAEKAWADLQASARNTGKGNYRPPNGPPNDVGTFILWATVAGSISARIYCSIAECPKLDPKGKPPLPPMSSGLATVTPAPAPTPTLWFPGSEVPNFIATATAQASSPTAPTSNTMPTATTTPIPTPSETPLMPTPDQNGFIE
jgi:hypothetical protein